MLLFQKFKKWITSLSIEHHSTNNLTKFDKKYRYTCFFNNRNSFYKNPFPPTTTEWNNIDQEYRKCENCSLFCCNILKFIWLSLNRFFKFQTVVDINIYFKDRSHGSESFPRFEHNFQDTSNLLCHCSMDFFY